MEQVRGGIRDKKATTFPLTYQEIAIVKCSGGAAPTEYIVETLAKWKLLPGGLVLNLLNTEGHCYDWTKKQYIYMLPEDGDQLVQDLADLSLTHNIIALRYDDYEYNVFFEESNDGTTNIDVETIEAFRRTFKEG